MPSEFLTKQWFEDVEKIREEFKDVEPPAAMKDLKLNIVVTEAPDGDTEVHMEAGNFGQGLLADAPTKLTVPYDVAKAVFIEGNQQAAMQAFMQGKVKVEGDMTKLMAMQAGGSTNDDQARLQARLKEITA